MTRPVPTQVLHFTRVEHLRSIVRHGLLSDSLATSQGVLEVEVGNIEIKQRRAGKPVPVPPGGVVADYVPFYFAPRSPMMFVIHKGGVPTYQAGCDRMVYLESTVERLQQLGLDVVLTDRNAALNLAEFWPLARGEPAEDFIEWPLMRARYWRSTEDRPDRRERRMAECLAYRGVQMSAFTRIVTKTRALAHEATAALYDEGSAIPVVVEPDWYF